MKELKERVEKLRSDGGHGRKDMCGVCVEVGWDATRSFEQSKRCKEDLLSKARTRMLVAGGGWFGDRRAALNAQGVKGVVLGDRICGREGCGGAVCDAEHWFWNCGEGDDVRRWWLDDLEHFCDDEVRGWGTAMKLLGHVV